MAPPLIPIVLKVAETTEVDSRAVKYMIAFAQSYNAPPIAKSTSELATSISVK